MRNHGYAHVDPVMVNVTATPRNRAGRRLVMRTLRSERRAASRRREVR